MTQNKKIYISYAWGELLPEGTRPCDVSEEEWINHEREKIVDDIEKALEQESIAVIRDKRIKGVYNIDKLMQKMGQGNHVIFILSDKFFNQSFYTPIEISYVMGGQNKPNKTVFPILVENFNTSNITNYKQQEKLKNSALKNIQRHLKERYCLFFNLIKKDKVGYDKYSMNLANMRMFIEYITNPNSYFKHDEIDKLVQAIKGHKNPYYGISGVSEFDIPGSKYQTNEYLRETYSFISRTDFNKESNQKKIEDENDYFNKVFCKNSTQKGIFIEGKGGVGKTRLMAELGRTAKKKGWTCIEINNLLKDITKLPRVAKKYCLIFDYVEEIGVFDLELIGKLSEHYNEAGKEFRVIANARKTYISSKDIPISDFLKIDFSEQEDYFKYVLQKMSEANDIPEWINRPSFITFYLKNEAIFKKKYDSDYLKIDDLVGFKEFLRRRLSLTFNIEGEARLNFNSINRDVFNTFASLPLLENNDYSENQFILDRLLEDGWIKLENNYYVCEYNDTIIDNIFMEYLEEKAKIVSKINDIFNFLNKANFPSKFRALDRISNVIDDEYLIKPLENNLEEVKKIGIIFAKSSLLSVYNKFKFIKEHELLKITDFDYVATLSRLISEDLSEEQRKEVEDITIQWIKDFKNTVEARFVIKAYLENKGKFNLIEDITVQWIKDFKNTVEARFVIKAYLENKGKLNLIEDITVQWIKDFKNTVEANFVIKAYLENKGKLNLIEDITVQWIKDFKNTVEANFVIKAYLENKGKLNLIEDITVQWIKDFKNTVEASFVIQPYLENKGKLNLIEDITVQWIKDFKNTVEANFVIKAYLENKGKLNLIEDITVQWIKDFKNTVEARFVIKAYLENKGKLNLIEDITVQWIKDFKNTVEANFVIKAYLENKGKLNLIEDITVQWIKDFKNTVEANFVIKAYLENKGKLNLIEDITVQWIKDFKNTVEASFVIQPYLENKGKLNLIEDITVQWIKDFKNTVEANFVIKAYLENKGKLNLIEDITVQWIKDFKNTVEANFVIKAYLENKGKLNLIEDITVQWIKDFKNTVEASFVIKAYLENKGKLNLIEDITVQWIKDFKNTVEARFVIKAYLENKGKLNLIEDITVQWIKDFKNTVEANFVIKAYLENKGKLNLIEDITVQWIKDFKNTVEANFVIKAYLENKGKLNLIEDITVQWIKDFKNTVEARFVIEPYLKNQGDLKPIQTSVESWINEYWNNQKASFVIGPYLKNQGDLKPIQTSVESWINEYWNNQKASFVIGPYLKNQGDLKPIQTSVESWINNTWNNQEASFVIQAYLKNQGDLKPIQTSIENWINKYWNQPDTNYVIRYYLKSGGDSVFVKNFIEINWKYKKSINFIIELLLYGEASSHTNIESINNFISEFEKKLPIDISKSELHLILFIASIFRKISEEKESIKLLDMIQNKNNSWYYLQGRNYEAVNNVKKANFYYEQGSKKGYLKCKERISKL